MRAHRHRVRPRSTALALAVALLLPSLAPVAATASDLTPAESQAPAFTAFDAPTLVPGQTPSPGTATNTPATNAPADEDPAHTAPPPTEPEGHSWGWGATAALLLGAMLALWLRDRGRRKDT